ncbi:MAG: DNA phosphorothioation-associated protein 4 [Ignavibacteriales bacterium]
MSERRVRVPKEKESIIRKLTGEDGTSPGGIFETRAHLLTFAAVYGFSKGPRQPFSESLEPIRQEVFTRNGFDTVINLIALADTGDPRCLALNDEADSQRVTIFEEYANAGLGCLISELQGISDPLEHFPLMLKVQDSRRKDSDVLDVGTILMESVTK